jgi:hypothetical protein
VDSKKYIMFDVVPDGEDVVLSKAPMSSSGEVETTN